MKKSLFFVAFIVLCTIVSAQNVSFSDAQKVASNCYYSHFSRGSGAQKEVAKYAYCQSRNNDTLLYVFNFGASGFVIVSADYSVTPILGFSDEGNFDVSQMSPSMEYWLGTYSDQIEFAKAQNPNTMHASWIYYLNDNSYLSKQKDTKDVSPLLTTKWDQGNGYNYHCPPSPNGPGGKCYAGCVATAMAQIMKYYNYPEHGTGSHSYYDPYYISISANFDTTYYDWGTMTNVLTTTSREAISTLIYQCGVAVNMNYSATGSSASSWSVPYAVSHYFGYRPVVSVVSKGDYTLKEWLQLLHDNIDEKHPLYYSGSGSEGGHAFIFDGYKDSTYFHINWGWSGSGNGYFTVDNLNSGNGDFTSGQQTILDFVPYNAKYCLQNRILTDKSKLFGDGSGYSYYWNDTQCDWLIQPPNADKIVLSFTNFNTEQDKDYVNVYDGNSAQGTLLGQFSGHSLPPVLTANSGKMFITFSSDGQNQDFGWEAMYSGVTTNIDENSLSDAIAIYPVPVKDALNIVVSSGLTGNASLTIYNITGQLLSTRRIDLNNNSLISSDVSALNPGMYLIELNTGTYSIHKKFVKQ